MSDLTKDELWVSMLFVVTFLPVLFFGPLGGLLADRLDRKKLLLGSYAALIVVSGSASRFRDWNVRCTNGSSINGLV